jgi:hypothetical protein
MLIDAMHIRCGATSPDPIVQAILDAKTLVHDLSTGEDHSAGCGILMLWWDSYRCVDCEKFMHRECLRKHFADTAG